MVSDPIFIAAENKSMIQDICEWPKMDSLIAE
jgi:hypothetical protein